MRKCRFCAEEIQDAAVVCSHCGRDLVASAVQRRSGAAADDAEGDGKGPTRVSVVDVNMPFGSMVGFMVKWALAAIPALAVLFLFGAIFSAIFGGLMVALLGRR